jgi:hypothetical protein
VALRAALTVAAQFGFEGSVMDVRTAFLNAPMVLSGSKDEKGERMEPKRAIIRPPALLILAGLARPDEFYEVIMALYGYKESLGCGQTIEIKNLQRWNFHVKEAS